ncbi:hypothetical protein [Rhodoferax sp. BLA1]|uniref:hypothetical protein n=1 Tax=Rhodoferax sp. BLA1 TaxID=2576062 RepID=UPI0015D0D567|nr:hypothetical protein [Rhodoferax sp. BLA1]
MPISPSTLSTLQKLGAAAFNADEKLKNEVAAYAQRANAAIFNNPYNLGNAALIESWQVAARLSKKLSGIEEELRELYRIAGELTEEDLPIVRETRALSAPASASTKKAAKQTATEAVDLSATTVKVKKATKKQTAKAAKAPTAASTAKTATPPAKGKKTAAKTPAGKSAATPTAQAAKPAKPASKAPVTKSATKAITKGAKVKATKAATATQELQGNPAKLLAHLLKVLNTDSFEHIIQTVVAKETNIPLGSMTAALARLTKEGRLVAGPQGSYKLAKVVVKAAKKSPAPAKTSAAAPEKTPVPTTTAAHTPTPAQPEVQAVATPEAQA